MNSPQSDDDRHLSRAVANLLAQHGVSASFELSRLAGGRNNRVYRVDNSDNRWLLKWYFFHPGDPRNRLAAEFDFCGFAWRHSASAVPRPVACDVEHRLGLYGFIDGRKLQPGEVEQAHVGAALDFWETLNRHKFDTVAMQLGDASEACFSLDEHLAGVDRRVQAAASISLDSDEHRAAQAFVRQELQPAWLEIEQATRNQVAADGTESSKRLDAASRCLSPSDFGFHNALLDDGGQLVFIDFEYAGWDDPARLVCDFFCQVEVPVPSHLFAGFADAVARSLPESDEHRRRMDLLLPVYRCKWCCILLNGFLPVGQSRRQFGDDRPSSHREQLDKAVQALRDIPQR